MMCPMKRRMTATLVIVMTAVVLAGCASGPSVDEVSERFVIEYAGAADLTKDSARVMIPDLDAIAQAAIDGRCGDEEYRDSLVDANDRELVYAWDSTCLMYFEEDMSATQIARAKQSIVDEAVKGIGDE